MLHIWIVKGSAMLLFNELFLKNNWLYWMQFLIRNIEAGLDNIHNHDLP